VRHVTVFFLSCDSTLSSQVTPISPLELGHVTRAGGSECNTLRLTRGLRPPDPQTPAEGKREKKRVQRSFCFML